MNRQSNKITALYARVDRSNGFNAAQEAINWQIHTLMQYADDRGMENTQVFYDQGFSGRTIKRPAFLKLMLTIFRGGVSSLVVVNMDRLYRSALAKRYLVKILMPRYGVAFHSLHEGIIPENTQPPLCESALVMLGGGQ